MCLVANGHDGNGIQLENFWHTFFPVSAHVSDKISKNITLASFSRKGHLIWFPCYSDSNLSWARSFDINLANLCQKWRKKLWDWPLKITALKESWTKKSGKQTVSFKLLSGQPVFPMQGWSFNTGKKRCFDVCSPPSGGNYMVILEWRTISRNIFFFAGNTFLMFKGFKNRL